MELISHRGNIDGIIKEKENHPLYIDNAINMGFDVEIDVFYFENNFYLGHDKPDYIIEEKYFHDRSDVLYVHCKNIEAFILCRERGFKCFYHNSEKHVAVCNTNLIWTHDIIETTNQSIIPMLAKDDINFIINHIPKSKIEKAYGICTDEIKFLESEFDCWFL